MKAPKPFATDARHQTFKRDLDKLLKKHIGRLSAQDLLAVASQVVGMIVALQDQRTMTPDMAIAIVIENIQVGNTSVVMNLNKTKGSA
jgi:hypothetical protein